MLAFFGTQCRYEHRWIENVHAVCCSNDPFTIGNTAPARMLPTIQHDSTLPRILMRSSFLTSDDSMVLSRTNSTCRSCSNHENAVFIVGINSCSCSIISRKFERLSYRIAGTIASAFTGNLL